MRGVVIAVLGMLQLLNFLVVILSDTVWLSILAVLAMIACGWMGSLAILRSRSPR